MPSVNGQAEAIRGVCAITGASGYVGSRLLRQLASDRWEVRAFSRSSSNQRHLWSTHVHFELGGDLASDAFDGVDALVHPAYDFALTRWPDIERVNVDGSRRLLRAASDAGVERIVLVSTLAAFPGAHSLYGRAKLAIERAASSVGAAIVRPGLVWGPQGAAMFGALRRAVERLPIVPLLGPSPLELSVAHEDDLALLVSRLLARWPQASRQLLVAASTQTLEFSNLLRSLAPRADSQRRFVRMPWRPVWLALRTLEMAGASPPFSSDNLVSFVSIDPHPFTHATDRAESYGVRFRPYSSQ
jgi:nucleoside-diphosphate-sugar epimerase